MQLSSKTPKNYDPIFRRGRRPAARLLRRDGGPASDRRRRGPRQEPGGQAVKTSAGFSEHHISVSSGANYFP